MSIFDRFPWTNFHELNLDEIIRYAEDAKKSAADSAQTAQDCKDYIENFDKELQPIVEDVVQQMRDDGTLANIVNNLAVVEDYGAIGDGTTDSTTAIQRCLDNNPGATICFKGGTYCISKTLEAWGASGGQCLLLGGATLKWTGAQDDTSVMLRFEKPYTPSISSVPRVIGGNFDGSDRCGTLIQSHTFYTDIGSAKFINCRKNAILLGNADGSDAISAQAKIHQCHFFMNGSLSSLDDTRCITIYDPDNQISDCVSYMYGCFAYLACGGNSFVNCHSTPGYLSNYVATPENWTAAHIVLDPPTSGHTGVNLFSNCYFNVGKYVVYNKYRPCSLTIHISNSHYTYYSSADLPFPGEGFIWGGYRGILELDGFDVLHGDNFTMYDYWTSDIPTNTTLPKKLDVARSERYPERSVIQASNHCTVAHRPVNVVNANNPASLTDVWYEVGAVIMSYTPVGNMTSNTRGGFAVEYGSQDRSNKAVFGFSGDTPVLRYEESPTGFTTTQFRMGTTPKSITLQGNTYQYYSMYIKCSNFSTTRRIVKMYPLDAYCKCYVRSHVNANTPTEADPAGIDLAQTIGLTFPDFTVTSAGVQPR